MIPRVLRGDTAVIKKFIDGCKNPRKLRYIIDSNEADLIVKKFKNVQDSYVFELRPGPSVLSQAFLRAGCGKVYCVETCSDFKELLAELKNSNPDRYHPHVVASFDEIGQDMLDIGEHFMKTQQDVQPIDWCSDKIFGRVVYPLQDLKVFFYPWIEHMLFRSGIFYYGRCELAIFMEEKYANSFFKVSSTGRPTGPQMRVASLLCDIEVLHTMEASVFYPKRRKKNMIKLVSFIPKKDSGIRVSDMDLPNIYPLIKLLFLRPARSLEFHFKILVEDFESFLNQTGLDKKLRPKNLTEDQLVLLINSYFQWEYRNDFLLQEMLKKVDL